MMMTRRPLLRAAAMAGGAYVAGRKAADRRARGRDAAGGQEAQPNRPEEPQATADDAVSAVHGASAGPSDASLSSELAELTRMRDQGVLTDQEFSAAKARLLGI